MIGTRSLLLVFFRVNQLRRFHKFLRSFRVFILPEKRVAEVVMRLVRLIIFLQSATIIHLRFGEVILVVVTIAVTDIRCFLLSH